MGVEADFYFRGFFVGGGRDWSRQPPMCIKNFKILELSQGFKSKEKT